MSLGKVAEQDAWLASRELPAGTVIDQFVIVRMLARGGMGEVYLARDTKLGRRVALKLIHPELLAARGAVEQFLAEARITAKFDHPHIVQLYAVGEHLGLPYVALAYLEGQDLGQRLTERRLSRQEALRFALAIAEALEEAHRHGVLHRDLKPANVVIVKDGRLRVVDFGLAKALRTMDGAPASVRPPDDDAPLSSRGATHSSHPTTAVTMAGGSPFYMAPEQWREEKTSQATDVWSLGIMLFEMCAGRRPFEEDSLDAQALVVCSEEAAPRLDEHVAVPAELVELVDHCLQKEADKRPEAPTVVAALRAMLNETRRLPTGEQSPFRALLPFTEEHAGLFFGREDEIAAFLERMRHQPLIAVVGPSGVGKSSFVQAGVIVRLREQERWSVVQLRPGSRPLEALAASVLKHRTVWQNQSGRSRSKLSRSTRERDSSDEPSVEQLVSRIREGPHNLALALRALAEQLDAKVLLFVDQLEELFTLTSDTEARACFLDAICSAAEDPLDPVRVVFTVRGDFIDRVATSAAARNALGSVSVIASPGTNALREILVKPLQALGFRYEDDALVDEMVAELSGEATSLPLLQFAAQQLWEQRDKPRKLLLRSVYDQIGGVAGALAKHADAVLEGFSGMELRLARELLLRMVTAERTRRVISSARALEGLPSQAEKVLARLTGARLISASTRVGEEEATLEIVHESLIHNWHALSRWLDASRDELSLLAEVGQAAELWDKRGRRPGELWRDAALFEAQRLSKQSTLELPSLVRQFLQVAAARQGARKRARRLTVGGAIVTLAVGVLVLAFQKREADFQRARAEQREQLAEQQRQRTAQQRAEALREGARAALGQGRLLETRAKLRLALEIEDNQTARALWWQLVDNPLHWTVQSSASYYDLAFTPDGKTVAVASQDEAVYLFDTTTRAVRVLRGHDDQVFAVAVSADGKRLVSGSWDGKIVVWDLQRGRIERNLVGHQAGVRALVISPDGEQAASASFDRTVRIWQLKTGVGRVIGTHRGRVWGVDFSADGKRLLSASDDETARIWDVASGGTLAVLQHDSRVRSARFSPDQDLVATGLGSGDVGLWDPRTAQRKTTIKAHQSPVLTLAFSPDSKLLVTGSEDRTLKLWELAGSRQLRFVGRHGDGLRAVAFSPDGKQLASAAVDHTVRLWDLKAKDLQVAAASTNDVGHHSGTNTVAFSPDGKLIGTAGVDQVVRLWDASTGREWRVLDGHIVGLFGLSFSPDGKLVAGGGTNRVLIWRVASGEIAREITTRSDAISAIRFHPGGTLLATAGNDRTVRLWSMASSEPGSVLGRHDNMVNALSFSPDGKLLASSSADRTVRIWEVPSGREQGRLSGHSGSVFGVAFGPAGKRLATTSFDGSVRLWDVAGGQSKIINRHEGRAYSVAFSADGQHVASTGSDGLVRVARLGGGASMVLRGHRAETNFVAFDPSGALLASTSDDATVRLWHVGSGQPAWRGPALLADPPRLLTHQGWRALDAGGHVRLPKLLLGPRFAQSARFVAQSSDRKHLCVLRQDDFVELLESKTGERIARGRAPAAVQVVAALGGCVVRTTSSVQWLVRSGKLGKLVAAGKASALAADGEQLLVAGPSEILRLDAQGAPVEKHPIGSGVSALAPASGLEAGRVVVGYRDGNIELQPSRPNQPAVSFEQVPSSRVERILAGPMNTIIVGYASGVLGMWDQGSGSRLASAHLHGPVVHLLLEAGQLYAATELGGDLRWELGPLHRDYCQLMREIWRRVPIVWSSGHAQRAAAPSQHPCALP